MVPCSPSDRAPDHGGDAEETDAPGQNHASVPLHLVRLALYGHKSTGAFSVRNNKRPPSLFLQHPAKHSLWRVQPADGIPPEVMPDDGYGRRRGSRGKRKLLFDWGGDCRETTAQED